MFKIFPLIFLFTLEARSIETVTFYRQNSSPKYFENSEKKLGLCEQVYAVLKKRLEKRGIKATSTSNLLPIKRILQSMQTGKRGVFCGAGRNKEREKIFIYSKLPVYHVSNVVAAREKETYIPKNFDDLKRDDIVVGAYHGTSSSKFLKAQGGIIVNDRIYDFESAFKLLETKNKFRYFYYHDLGLNYLIKNSHYQLVVLPTKFRTIPQWLLYSKDLPKKTIEILEAEFKKMHDSGELAEINDDFF